VARGCRGGGSKMLSHHLRQFRGSSSVRVCLNASLIRPICLRETVLPSTHRSRRLTAKDRKEARHPLQVNHFLYPCTGRGVPTPRATLLARRRWLAPSEGISRSL
jgi:hypothetical protein